MILQILIPQNIFAEEEKSLPQDKYVKVGMIDGKSYDAKIMNELNRIAAKNRKQGPVNIGTRLFSKGPYFGDNNEPKDADKPKYFGNVSAKLDLVGLDGNAFQWNEIFGVDESGNPKPAQIIFRQMDEESSTDTGLYYMLQITKEGKYTWSDGNGNPTKLPLFSKSLKPYRYEVRIDERVSDKVKLLTSVSFGTEGSSPTFLPENEDGEIIANITLGLTYQQIASTKFKSEWHTGVTEADRPGMKANFAFDDEGDGVSPVSVELPKNDKDTKIIRDWYNDFDPDLVISYYLEKTPDVKIDETTAGLTFDTANKTVSDGNHKFKYDFKYDVINGGKLTMTQVIPVTFDANGGKFASVTDPGADQKIVKEVDYEGTLADKAETPTMPGKAFKGWATDKNGMTPATDDDFKNIKEKKTFYAIWSNEDIQVEELKTTESLGRFPKRGEPIFTNDFVPTFEDLKAQVKVKNAKGDFVALPKDVTFSIVDDEGKEHTEDSVDLKKFIYEKVKEKDTDEVSRTETVKAKVKYSDGTEREVEIPITVLKNIYRGTDEGNKYPHIPENYVKVTIDPTDKAQNPDKTYYYVNPKAKVNVPVKDPVGAGDNKFSKWTMKADSASGNGADYTKTDRHQFTEASTITAQYGTGIIKIQYVDENGNVIEDKYKIVGNDYPSEKSGGLGGEGNALDFETTGPDFKGYIYSSRDSIKGKYYKDPKDPENLDVVKYSYFKKVTTEEPTNKNVYFPVIFDANGGEFKPDTVTQKTVYVYFDGNDATVEKVTFKEVKDEFEKAYSNPTKDGFDFKEWQNAKTGGKKPADDHEIQFKGWDWEGDPDNGYVPETFYAHYGKASALISYLDLDGKPIADDFKIDGVEYPTEKTGKAGENIAKDVFTEKTAPKFIGYKFNRIELNPKDGKYALDNKATIKIYYEKLPDVIPEKDGSGNPNEKPEGYVEVKFVPTDKAKDTTEKIFYVNPKKDVTIPVANPEAKATYTFKEWKMGANAEGATYTPSTAQKFTDDLTVITATYEETENIIPYDPSVPDPMVRPEGYVRVTFAADPGLKLTEQKAYYVKANAGITLKTIKDDTTKGYPTYEEQTGYKFKEWDKKDDLEIVTTDITVTAKATKLDNVIPEKDGEGNPNTKPEGYKEVTFVVKTGDEAKGTIEGVAKFYVNPTEYVKINPPATTANTGYEFGTWDKDATIPTVYEEDTTITGSFNGLKDVIPKTKDDESEKPKGYVTVTFELEKLDGKEAGKMVEGETITYFVKPNTDVTIPQPKISANTGYEFINWNPDTSKNAQYSKDTTVKGNFKKLDDIIPGKTGDTTNPKPEGYVTVTFDKGEHGKEITGQTVYYVNPKANITLGNETIVKPKVTPETGWKQKAAPDAWDTKDDFEIKADKTVKAQYEDIADVIPKTTNDESEKPDGYITVTFVKGEHGKELTGQAVYYVNPNKAVVLKEKAPTAVPNTGYEFARWDVSIDQAIQYKDGAKITALYNELGDVIPQEKTDGSDKPAGYLTVTFDKGDHGTLSGKTVYYVKPNKEVTVPAPTVTPNVGWKQKDGEQAWDSKLTRTFIDENTTITAQYDQLADIIPGDQTKPDGYFTVTFKAENGSLTGTTTYYVKPNVEVNLKDKADALTKNPNLGYTVDGGTWDPTLGPKTYTEDATYTFKFKKLDDIIPGDENTQRPKGYVKVEFRSDINGNLEGKTIFYVNPNAKKTMKDITPLPTIKANKGYKVGNPNWHPDFTTDTTEIKEDRIYVANYEALGEAKITYIPRDPEMGSVSPGSEDLSEDQEIKGSTAKANPGYEFVKWINTKGDTVSDNAKFVPSEKQSATYIAVFKAKDPITFTVNKVWEGDVSPLPTMNFTLYRKVDGGTEEAVPGAEVKEITKTNTEATWTNLPKENLEGKLYTYSVKESFKDTDVKNDNWILGEMVTDANGNTITNKLKTIPGTGDTPNEDEHRMCKLTITKKIESKVIKKQITTFGAKAPAAPLEFTFKVTDPYGKEETFTLKANETKVLENLLYGDYTVEETDAKGLTPFVKVGDGAETESKTGKVTLTTTTKEGTVTFTNKNFKPEENPNIIEVKATKVWENGPSKDHGAVELKLYRQVGDQEKVEVTDVNAEVTRVVSGAPTFNYVWKDLPKINDDGMEYTYIVEEANVTDGKVKVGDNTYTVTQDGNTITNTYKVPQTEDLIATKQWVDVPDGTATPEVKFQLQRTANGVTEDIGQAMDLTNDKVNFGKQDKTDVNGNVYVYSVKELDENGAAFNHTNYTSVVDGLSVTNTYHAPEVKYTVTYKAGSSTATGTMNTVTVAENTDYTVLANGFTNTGYTFKGWKVGNTTQIIQPGTIIPVKGDVTLTAIWEKTTTPPTPDPDKPNPWDPNHPNPWDPKPWNPNYPDLPYIPRYPEVRYETIVQEKIVKVPVPIADNAYVKEVRYMQGFMGDFRPKDGLTRAEAAQILANALVEDGYKYNPNFKLPYKDIGEAWYTRAVKIVTEAKVFAGYDDGNFKPQDKITRNEWIATLKRFQELGDVSGNHMKLKDGHWAMAEIEAAYKEGWLKIYSDGLATYEGDKFIPREEVAAVSNKAFNRVLDKTYIINNDKNLITYKDVKKDMWSYEDILCASNTFLYKKDLYRAHWIKEDNNQFNINTDGFEIVKAKFQRNPR
ncbi:InlB B-repeat-containing protein [Peptoniphilus grossensis]|uniref:InlB B-repeat-containing protein n=1 Tax=Peptoniphilus grossensis TaxID=1465756 RepID=UPI0039960590